MFNWFKNKVELKNENSIMTSSYIKRGVKIGSEIIVPNNFKCLIFNNGKYYFSLDSGKHKISTDKFKHLISAQHKTKRKKYAKMVCHYINLSSQSLVVKFKKQKFNVQFCITDTIKFANLMLLYAFKVDNDYTINTLNDVFVEGLLWINGDYNKINAEFFNDYGLTINSFQPENKKQSIFDKQDNLLVNTVEKTPQPTIISETPQDSSTHQTQSAQTEPISESNHTPSSETKFSECPKCKNITKFNTTYCLRCGFKLE